MVEFIENAFEVEKVELNVSDCSLIEFKSVENT